jgi:hypothetical protein
MHMRVLLLAIGLFALGACAQQRLPASKDWPVQRLDSSPEQAAAQVDAPNTVAMCGMRFVRPAISAAPQGTPPNVAAFLGQWGDCTSKWIYTRSPDIYDGIPYALYVTDVQPDGRAKVLSVQGKQPLWQVFLPWVKECDAQIKGDYISYTVVFASGSSYAYELHRVGDHLEGVNKNYHLAISSLAKK